MFAAIRIRGSINTKRDVIDTFKMLRLTRKNHCVLLKDTPDIKGMIKRVNDYLTYGEISEEMLKKMIIKRGRKPGNVRLEEKEVDKIIEEINTKKTKEWKIRPVFRLSPPSKGFRKSIKQHYPNGEVGYRGEKINELLEKMV